jgi:hypothetical protein
MSWNPDQQLRCQTCCKLYHRVEAIQVNQSALPWDSYTDNFLQLLAQQLITELQHAWSGSHLGSASAKDADDDDNDDDDDKGDEGGTGNDDCEENKDDNSNDDPHGNVDGPELATISCPHPACEAKPPYTQRNNLQRHYTNRRLLSNCSYMSYQETYANE